MKNVVRGKHEHAAFELRFEGQRKVHSHLVTVEVSVESRTNERVKTDRITFDELRIEGLNTQTVKRRSTVQHNRMVFNNLFENVPHFRTFCVNELLSSLERIDNAIFFQSLDDERLVKFESHALRKTALVHLEFRTHDDHGTARVVHALTEKVHTEAALLTLDEFRERLQRAGRTGAHCATTAIEQLVHCFLEHTLFVAENHVRSLDVNQLLQTVVAVDHATVEFVQVRGSETATIERNERTKIRRNHRKNVKNHPFRLVREALGFTRIHFAELAERIEKVKVLAFDFSSIAALAFAISTDDTVLEVFDLFGNFLCPRKIAVLLLFRIFVVREEVVHLGLLEGFHNLQALDGFVTLRFGLGSGFYAEFVRELNEIHIGKELLQSGGTHLGGEVTAFSFEVNVTVFVDQFIRLKIGITRIEHDVLFVINDIVEGLGVKIQNRTEHTRLVLHKPNVSERDGEFDMTHTFTTHLGMGNFHTATVANDALKTDTLVLTAVTFPVLHRSENAFAEQAITFRLERTVIDRFRLGNFTIGPLTDQFRRSKVNGDFTIVVFRIIESFF